MLIEQIAYENFEKIDIRVGMIVDVSDFPQAQKPAFKLTIDFGPQIGIRKSSAQLTRNYAPDVLVGTLVAAVVNFPPQQIGSFMSEALILGFPDEMGNVVLVSPDADVPLGGRLF